MTGQTPGRRSGPDKGKEKANVPSPIPATEHADSVEAHPATGAAEPINNFSARLADSAAHLSRSVLAGRPEPASLARLSSAGGTKADSRGAQPSVTGESSLTNARPSARLAVAGRSFRTEAEAHAAQSEADFLSFLDSTSVSVPSGGSRLDSAWPAASNHGGDQASRGHGADTQIGSVTEQEARDGLEVVDLLTRPETEMDIGLEPAVSERDIAAIRLALFGQDSQGVASFLEWDTMLNFIPDFIRPHDVTVSSSENAAKSMEAQAVLGVAHGPEAERIWLDQWMDVLRAYTGEVWGDLSDLVQQAKEEIQQLENLRLGDSPPEPKAVRRLQHILGHIRGF